METVKHLLVALLIFLSFYTFANDGRKEASSETIKAPAFVLGNPDEINTTEIEALKEINPAKTVQAPAIDFGTPEDINAVDVEALKEIAPEIVIKAPAFVTGSPEDLNLKDIEQLKDL
jgi:tRNA pseudouridine-54 N-methylase